MNPKHLQTFLANWPEGNQLSIYLTNGFSVAVRRTEDLAEIRPDMIHGTDSNCARFCIPTRAICLAKFQPDQTNAIMNKKHNKETRK